MNVPCKQAHLLDCDPYINLDHNLDNDPDNFALCKWGNDIDIRTV